MAIIAAVCAAVFAYTFRPALDMNGDTSQYYIYATSLAQGEGYAELGTLGHPPANGFPPGYPLLMAPLRAMTGSIVAQKMLNGLFLCGTSPFLRPTPRRSSCGTSRRANTFCSMKKSKQQVLIVGAGPAGLTAALELCRRSDMEVVVIERDEQVGGISRTVRNKGNSMDLGGHRYFSKSEVVTAWWQELLRVGRRHRKPLPRGPQRDAPLQQHRPFDAHGDGGGR